MTINQSFKFKLRDSAPAPHDESDEYQKFNKWLSVIAPVSVLIVTYGLSFFCSCSDELAEQISYLLPILEGRLLFLKDQDFPSYLSYVASVLGILISIPILVAIYAIGYWRTVVKPRRCLKASGYTLILIFVATLMSVVFSWILLVSVPETYTQLRPGMARILFWPFFPAIAAIWASTLANLLFSIIVGITKLVAQRGISYGR